MPRGAHAHLMMVALALPGAAFAFGLGDIRIHSALNEPLSAQVDILGATPGELQALKARIADAEEFHRYNADRPPYLSTVAIRLGTDAQGRPVLNMYSESPFTDPVVELLVDVRWASGELIRDYSLLLDPVASKPAAATAAAPVEIAAVIAPSPVIVQLAALPPAAALERERTAPAKGESPSALPRIDTGAGAYRVRPGDTLSRIVRRAGATSEADALRMMIAVYRGNPLAFDRNINRLRRNALLAMPSVAAISAMDATQARRDVAQHMNAWRHAAGGRPTSPTVNDVADVPGSTTIPFAGTPESISNPEPAATPDPAATPEPIANAVPGPATPGAEPVARATPRAPVSTPQPIASLDAAPPAPAVGAVRPVPRSARSVVGPGARLFVALSLLVVLPLLGLALLRLRRPRSVAPARPEVEPAQAMAAQAPEQTNELPQVTWHDSDQVRGGTVEMPTVQLPAAGIAAASADTGATAQIPGTTLRMPGVDLDDSADDTILMANAGGETTTTVPVDMETVVLEGMLDDDALLEATARGTRLAVAQGTVLDYNLVDLDAGDEHVHLPSDLHDRTNFVERRKNVVDALLAALQRDPTRNDLRVKLLETYFAQAAVNRRAFAEHVRSQACAPGTLSKEDWQKITLMKQELGLDLELPTDLSGDDLANCA